MIGKTVTTNWVVTLEQDGNMYAVRTYRTGETDYKRNDTFGDYATAFQHFAELSHIAEKLERSRMS